jgi:hypothetical protein
MPVHKPINPFLSHVDCNEDSRNALLLLLLALALLQEHNEFQLAGLRGRASQTPRAPVNPHMTPGQMNM